MFGGPFPILNPGNGNSCSPLLWSILDLRPRHAGCFLTPRYRQLEDELATIHLTRDSNWPHLDLKRFHLRKWKILWEKRGNYPQIIAIDSLGQPDSTFLQYHCLKELVLGGYDKRVISKLTLLTIPELFIGPIKTYFGF